MTIRDIIHEIDKESGRSEEQIANGTAFADKMLPEACRVLDRELAPHEVEAVRIEIRKLKVASAKAAKQLITAINASKN